MGFRVAPSLDFSLCKMIISMLMVIFKNSPRKHGNLELFTRNSKMKTYRFPRNKTIWTKQIQSLRKEAHINS